MHVAVDTLGHLLALKVTPANEQERAQVADLMAEVQEANRRLEGILRASQRERFGKSSEKLSPDQFNLPLEDAELAQGVLEAAQEKAEAALQRARGETPRKPARNRGHLPPHPQSGIEDLMPWRYKQPSSLAA